MDDSLPNSLPPGRYLLGGALRGAVAAIAMTGMRTFTVNTGIVGQPPPQLRAHRWAGPAYGLVIWLGFEAGIAPLLRLKQAGESRPAERAALAIDHLLYGLILSEGRDRG